MRLFFTVLFFLISYFSISQKIESKKVIVVGAGISGLAAAEKLVSAGFDVVVLEAQNTPGGRIKTNRDSESIFEEGASWIHGPKGNPISTLVDNSKIITYKTDDDNLLVYSNDGILINSDSLDEAYYTYEKALSKIENESDKKESLNDRFNIEFKEKSNDLLWQYMLSAYLEFDLGGDIKDISSRYFYEDEEFVGEDVIVTNGYDLIINYFSEVLDVKYNSKVISINYENDKVEVKTNNEKYIADAVIVTVPLGVLKKDVINFLPVLPTKKLKVIQNLEMGTVNKYLLEWDTAFWDLDAQYIGYTSEVKGQFNYFMNCNKFSEGNSLMTFSFGDYSVKTEQMDDSEIEEAIMNNLRNIYGDNIPSPKLIRRTRWNTNEFTFGSYSYASMMSGKKDFYKLSKSVKSKLFFAGEHTHQEYRGTVHGAYLSGIREADKIIKKYK